MEVRGGPADTAELVTSITPRSAGWPVSSSRPGSEVVTIWMVPFASVIRYVRALRASRCGQGEKPSVAGRGQAVWML